MVQGQFTLRAPAGTFRADGTEMLAIRVGELAAIARLSQLSQTGVFAVPGDPNGLKKETPTIAEFFKKNGYSTYFSGKCN
ncbi:MAG TPA: hypothetical protein VGL25_09955 [Casimicrobiaceae bacterium]